LSNERKFDKPAIYHIRVKGNLHERWSAWFDSLTITPQPGGDTLLTGLVHDQAALHGHLAKIRDLGLPLLSVSREGSHGENEGERQPAPNGQAGDERSPTNG
jgi:hypothetical protein